jgi:N-acetylglutamate synthase-like GNAT family acetyltransferase/DNA-binding transcriptional ArsR family regulator
MERDGAIAGLAALADGLRLSLLGALAREGAAGLSAGELASMLDIAPSTLSGPLRVLREAGLIERKRRGRLAVYRMERAAMAELSGFVAGLAAPAKPAGGFTLQPVHAESAGFIGMRATLEKNNLPADDLGGEGQRYFSLMDESGAAFGYGGLEGQGADQLLRSLIIYPTARGTGLGRVLVRLLEAQAREDGAQRLWLLTNDAEKYFKRLGYKTVDRAEAPKAIVRTKQFAKLCPASAKLMKRVVFEVRS